MTRLSIMLAAALLAGSIGGGAARAAEPVSQGHPEITGRLSGADVYRYRIAGKAGEPVTLALDAASGLVIFRLVRVADGAVIAANPVRFWSEKLPADGEYEIEIYLVDTAMMHPADFTLWVTLGNPALLAAVPGERS